MTIAAVFHFFARNPPSLLIGGGILGWLLCGLSNVPVFCNYWGWLIASGFILQLIWLYFQR